jgi:flagellin-like hook-associated protein FlgL
MRIGVHTSRLALDGLQRTSQALARALKKLSQGANLASPSEDAVAFALSSRLQQSASAKRIGASNLNQEIALLNVASLTIQTQIEITQKLRELSLRSSSDVLSAQDRESIQSEMRALLEEFNRVANETEFNGQQLFGGDFAIADLNTLEMQASNVFTHAQGTLQFQKTTDISQPLSIGDAELTDLDKDGHLDFISLGLSSVTIQLGDGSGSFRTIQTFSDVGNDLVVSDFNSDGIEDLAYTTSNTLNIRLGIGDGRFGSSRTFSFSNAGDLALGDFNEDGLMDIIGSQISSGANTLSLFVSDGEGGFTNSSTIAVGQNFSSSRNKPNVADLNADGHLDVVTHDFIDNTISVLLGRGDGSFNSRVTYNILTTPYSSILIDLDDDDDLDAVIGVGGRLRYLLNDGTGTFGASATLATFGSIPFEMRKADMNNDGRDDLVIDNVVFENLGSLNFQQIAESTGAGGLPTIGDINEDGVLDLYSGTFKSIQITENVSALSLLSSIDSANSPLRIKVIDRALDELNAILGKVELERKMRERQVDSFVLAEETYEAARAKIQDVDFSLTMTEVVSLQIQQQAQLAALAQGQVQMRSVLTLLDGLL